MISPGSRVMAAETKLISSDTPKIRSPVRADWRTWPLRRVSTLRSSGSIPVSIQGPMGAKVSKLLDLVHCPSSLWTWR